MLLKIILSSFIAVAFAGEQLTPITAFLTTDRDILQACLGDLLKIKSLDNILDISKLLDGNHSFQCDKKNSPYGKKIVELEALYRGLDSDLIINLGEKEDDKIIITVRDTLLNKITGDKLGTGGLGKKDFLKNIAERESKNNRKLKEVFERKGKLEGKVENDFEWKENFKHKHEKENYEERKPEYINDIKAE